MSGQDVRVRGLEDLVLVSNRGPLVHDLAPDGSTSARRGAGGLVSGLAPIMAGTGGIWVAAALSPGDRVASTHGLVEHEGLRVRMLDIDQTIFAEAYDVVCNATLWFCHHHLFDLARQPIIDNRWLDAWDAYREMNDAFSAAVAEAAPEGATVLVQDYHLCLVPARLRETRSDLSTVHFSHTPFACPDVLAVLPDMARTELLRAMAAADACGFHSPRWASAFSACCERDGVTPPTTFAAPLATDVDDIRTVATSEPCNAALARLEEELAGRQFVVRVDRIELSKNLLRGFDAFERALELDPALCEQVVMGAFVYSSREGLADYVAYREQVEDRVEQINRRWSRRGWTPVLMDTEDDFPTSVAALRRYDVLLVNPIRDGLNLVATEGPMVNERDGSVLLSREAGAWDLLSEVTDAVHPYDIEDTAEKLVLALRRDSALRRDMAESLRSVAMSRTPADWLEAQLRAPGGC